MALAEILIEEPESGGEDQSRTFDHTAEFRNGTVDWSIEIPRDMIDPVPLLIAPGFMGIKPGYEDFAHELALAGKPTITFDPVRAMKNFADLHPKHLLHPELLLSETIEAIAKKALEFYGEKLEFTTIDLSGHSTGGVGVVNAAMHRPELYRNVILVGSAGLNPHSIRTLAPRFAEFIRKEIPDIIRQRKVADLVRYGQKAGYYFLRNIIRTVGEGIAVAQSNIREEVDELTVKGLMTAAIVFYKDTFFKLEEVEFHSGEKFLIFRPFPHADAGHAAPQIMPKEMAQHHIEIINDLAELEKLAS